MSNTSKFAAAARKETSLSPVMEGRNKLSMEEMMKKYPNGVTVTEFDFISIYDPKKQAESTFPVCAFSENDRECFFGGTVLSNICKAWADLCDGDIEGASEELKSSGGVHLRFKETKTRMGNKLISVEVAE